MAKPDYWWIHKLEYDLGFRDDPPKPRYTDKPGSIICWDPNREARPTYITLNEDWMSNVVVSDCRFESD